MKGVVSQFHKQFPKYKSTKVVVDWIPWANRTQDWTNALTSGKGGPDITELGNTDTPGWAAPDYEELAGHFDEHFLSLVPPGTVAGTLTKVAEQLREELVVLWETPRAVRAHEEEVLAAQIRVQPVACERDLIPAGRICGPETVGRPLCQGELRDARAIGPHDIDA